MDQCTSRQMTALQLRSLEPRHFNYESLALTNCAIKAQHKEYVQLDNG